MAREKITGESIVPKPGERALIIGATGSGKTAFACFILQRLETVPIIIYDTKEEDKFKSLPGSIIVTNEAQTVEALQNDEIDYIIYRPDIRTCADPDALDELLMAHYEQYHNTVAYIDELYQFHKNGRHGPGLQGLLTRGRSRGITTIMSTQRPAYISRFAITESQKFYIFFLLHADDKKRIDDISPEFSDLREAQQFGFYYFAPTGSAKVVPKLYPPIKLDPKMVAGYIDTKQEETPSEVLDPLKSIWI